MASSHFIKLYIECTPIMMNIFNALKDIGQLENNLSQMKDKLKEVEVEGASGGGLVKVKMNGNFSLISLTLDPIVVNASDIKMLEDLIVAAHCDAVQKIQEKLSETIMPMATGLMRQ